MPATEGKDDTIDCERAGQIIKAVRDSGRTILTEFESKQLLSAYGIPTVDTRLPAARRKLSKRQTRLVIPLCLKSILKPSRIKRMWAASS